MNAALKSTTAFLDAKGARYRIEDDDRLATGFKASNKGSIQLTVVFDDDCESLGIRSFDFVKFPADKIDKMFKLCSQINRRFRWVKFYVDESDNTITLAIDAVITTSNCGPVCYELMGRMVDIGNDAYPEFMKALWT